MRGDFCKLFARCFRRKKSNSVHDERELEHIPTRKELSPTAEQGKCVAEVTMRANGDHLEGEPSSGEEIMKNALSISSPMENLPLDDVDLVHVEVVEDPKSQETSAAPALIPSNSHGRSSASSASSEDSESRFGDRSSGSSASSNSSLPSAVGSISSREGPSAVLSARAQGSGFRSVRQSSNLNSDNEASDHLDISVILKSVRRSSEDLDNKENKSGNISPPSAANVYVAQKSCESTNLRSLSESSSNSSNDSSQSSSGKTALEGVLSQSNSSLDSFKSAVDHGDSSQGLSSSDSSRRYATNTSFANSYVDSSNMKNASTIEDLARTSASALTSPDVSEGSSGTTFTSSTDFQTRSSLTSSDRS